MDLLAHHVYGFGLDVVADADFARLAEWVLVLAEVLFGEAIDMRVGILFVLTDYAAADSDIAIRILGIDYRERDLRAGLQVLRLDPATRGVDTDFSVGVVEPDRGDLRGSVGHHGCDAGERFLAGEEVEKFLGDGF